MILFHKKHIPIKSNQVLFFHLIGNYSILFLKDNKKKLDDIRPLFKLKNNTSSILSNHLFDCIYPLLNDRESFIVLLILYRMADKGVIISDHFTMTKHTLLDRPSLLNCLSVLEENLLIKISGTHLIKIELNQNWLN